MHITWSEANLPWNEVRGSQHIDVIRQLVGTENRRDALHIDSAFKSGCAAFVTADNDVLSKQAELQAMLGVRFFHPDEAALYEFILNEPS